ncbi:MAG: NAD-binding protein [Thermoplasmata archaeon]|nr:NAD-binding protein [Thermoplasmata archaeon]
MRCIVCGYGVVGRNVAETLDLYSIDYIVIDRDRTIKPQAGVPFIHGDAKDEEVLRKAGIDRVDILIACTDSDAENAFITLAAKDLNPEVRVLSRATELESVDKLYMAGADYVVSLAQIAARNLVKMAVLPYRATVRDELTVTRDTVVTSVVVPPDSDLLGRTISGSRIEEMTGVSVIGFRRSGAILPNPVPDAPFIENDVLIVVGSAANLNTLERIVHGEKA